jgi:hypothetical protein
VRHLARIFLAIAVGVPIVAATPGRAVACACALRDASHVIAGADAIVAGHVVADAAAGPTRTMSSLAIDGVYEGDVGPTVTLSTEIGPAGASDCAVLYPVGSEVDPVVLQERPDGTYVVDACAMPVVRQVAKALGVAHPPQADGPPAVPLPSPVEAPPPAAAPPAGSAQHVSWPAVLAGALIGVGLIAWAIRKTAREHVGGGDEEHDEAAPPPGEPSG